MKLCALLAIILYVSFPFLGKNELIFYPSWGGGGGAAERIVVSSRIQQLAQINLQTRTKFLCIRL